MTELIRTNDLVLLSFAEALLRDAGIGCTVLDQNMSVIEGSLGVLPRRLLVDSDRLEDARTLLSDAGLGKDLR
jgi:Putative prokaryotic signal transducing protein